MTGDLLVLNDDSVVCPDCYEPPIVETPDDLVMDVISLGECKYCGSVAT